MNKKSINPLLLIGFIGSLTIGSTFTANLLEAFYGNKDIYWTHKSIGLSINDTNNDFQLMVAGKPIQKHLEDKTLSVERDGVKQLIVSKDISVRLNNWDKVRSKKLIMAIFTGFLFGINLTLLIMGIMQVITKKGNKQNC